MCLEVEIYMLRLHLHIFFLCLLMTLSCQRYPDPYTEAVPEFVSIESHVQGSSVVMTAVLEKALPNKFECGFYYGLKGTEQTKVEAQLQGSRVILEQSGLMSASNYTFKAYITNGRNERCSFESTFSTDPEAPPVDPDDSSTNPDEPETPPTDEPETPPVDPDEPLVDPDDPSTNPDEPETPPTEDPVTPPADDPSTEPEIPPTDDPVTPPVVDPEEPTVELIDFADEGMKNACVAAFDRDNDGELSVEEAADVRNLASLDLKGLYVTSFDEFRYFTSVETVPYECFKGQLLNSIVFPSGLKTICESAFAECIGLTAVEIPSGVREIGNSVFKGCSNIRSVTLPQTVGTIGEHAFRSCTSLKTINLPESLTVLNKWVFYQCSSLSRVTLPENLRIIHDGALSSCYSLQEVTVPSGVLSIGYDAFADCRQLADVYMLPADPPLMGTTAFNTNPSYMKIHVPASSYDRYLSGIGWESYTQYLMPWEY